MAAAFLLEATAGLEPGVAAGLAAGAGFVTDFTAGAAGFSSSESSEEDEDDESLLLLLA